MDTRLKMETIDMASLEHVYFSYGDKKVFQDFSCQFSAGCTTAVTGPSGAGKTTLLGLLTGSLKPLCGSVHTDGPVAVMFQEPRLLPWFSVRKNLTAVLETKKDTASIQDTIAMKWLAQVHLDREADNLPDSLSGGMQQRASLARLLAYAQTTDASLVILDEPFSALDPDLHAEMRALTLNALKGKTVILITHDAGDAGACDRQLVLGG